MKMIPKGGFRVCFQPITMLNCCTTCISWEIGSCNTQQSHHNQHTHFCRNFVARSAIWFSENEGGGAASKAVWNISENSSVLETPSFPYYCCRKVFDICSGDYCCDMKRFNAHGAWIFIMKWLRTATKHLTLVLLCLKMSMDGSRLLLKSQWLQFCWVGGGRLAGKRCGKRVWGKTKDKVGQLYRRTTFPHLAHLRQQSFFTFCSDAIESITPSLTVALLNQI